MNVLILMPKNAAKSSGGYNVFPVGIAYVSAYLKKHKKTGVFTSNLEYHPLSSKEAIEELISKFDIDLICTGGLSRDYPKLREIVTIAKAYKSTITTVIGGGIISGDPEPAMTALDADFGIIGQGEVTICELIDALETDSPIDNIPGLIYFSESQKSWMQTKTRNDITDLDALPFPDYDGFDFDNYMKTLDYEVVYVIGSRSCPYRCTFCFHPSGKRYAARSMDNLFEEIDMLLTKYPVRNLVVSDELFSFKKERVIDFCNRIAKYKVNWGVQLRVSDVDKDLLYRMRKAGCSVISYGIESADNSILESMQKKITLDEIEHALEETFNADIAIQGGLIFGDIAETFETAMHSLEWNDNHLEYGLELNMIGIFPGTPLYHHAVKMGVIKDPVKFLKSGCPLINISKLSNDEYKRLASMIYERNMQSKYLPDKYSIISIKDNGASEIEFTCNKCGTKNGIGADILHIARVHCSKCLQRYYVDPFLKIEHDPEALSKVFEKFDSVAIWGAGEICIKMLKTYHFLKDEKFKVIDFSKSRQGYFVQDKVINNPDIITNENIETLVIAVVQRKDEVIKQIKEEFPQIKTIFLPIASMKSNTTALFNIIKI